MTTCTEPPVAFVGRDRLQRVEIRRQRGDEGLAFAGDHFGDVALVQHHAAEHLHVVMPQPEEAAATFAANGKGLDQDVVERFARARRRRNSAVWFRSSSSVIA